MLINHVSIKLHCGGSAFFYVLKQLYLLYVPTGGVMVNTFAYK